MFICKSGAHDGVLAAAVKAELPTCFLLMLQQQCINRCLFCSRCCGSIKTSSALLSLLSLDLLLRYRLHSRREPSTSLLLLLLLLSLLPLLQLGYCLSLLAQLLLPCIYQGL
jgi:ABC-type uncharacterized transport system YnjBCD permease subunit